MREIRTLRATWRGLETWNGRETRPDRRASPRPYLCAIVSTEPGNARFSANLPPSPSVKCHQGARWKPHPPSVKDRLPENEGTFLCWGTRGHSYVALTAD